MLQDLQAQVITKKAQFPLVPDATLECQAWPGVKLRAMGVSRSTKEWEIAETGLPCVVFCDPVLWEQVPNSQGADLHYSH